MDRFAPGVLIFRFGWFSRFDCFDSFSCFVRTAGQLGRRVAEAEAQRLESQLRFARTRLRERRGES